MHPGMAAFLVKFTLSDKSIFLHKKVFIMEKSLLYIKIILRIVRAVLLIIPDDCDLGFDFEDIGIVFDFIDSCVKLLEQWCNKREKRRRKYK